MCYQISGGKKGLHVALPRAGETWLWSWCPAACLPRLREDWKARRHRLYKHPIP